MADATPPLTTDLEEQLGRIRRAREESETFVAEQRTPTTEAMKLERDRVSAPSQVALSGMAAEAALFGAGAAFSKSLTEILGPCGSTGGVDATKPGSRDSRDRCS